MFGKSSPNLQNMTQHKTQLSFLKTMLRQKCICRTTPYKEIRSIVPEIEILPSRVIFPMVLKRYTKF